MGVRARLAANHRHSTGGSEPGMSLGKSRYRSLEARGRPSGVVSAGEGPIAKILNGAVQLSESFALRTLESVPALAPCRMVAAVLWVHT